MAFASNHLEEAFEKKAVEYILDGTTKAEIVAKKWSRVPEKHHEWCWGNVQAALAKKGDISQEQKDRLAEIKSIVGK